MNQSRFLPLLVLPLLVACVSCSSPKKRFEAEIKRDWVGHSIDDFIVEFGLPWNVEPVGNHKTYEWGIIIAGTHEVVTPERTIVTTTPSVKNSTTTTTGYGSATATGDSASINVRTRGSSQSQTTTTTTPGVTIATRIPKRTYTRAVIAGSKIVLHVNNDGIIYAFYTEGDTDRVPLGARAKRSY